MFYNRGVFVQQVAQWLLVTILPITTCVFLVSGTKAFRIHGCSFDSIVLFLCAAYNLLYIVRGTAICTDTIQLSIILFMTGMILYLYVNFEVVIDNMQREMIATEKGVSYHETSTINVTTLEMTMISNHP